MKFLIVAVLVGLIALYAAQPRARLLVEFDKINPVDEFYFAGDFRSPSACEHGLTYYGVLPGQKAPTARCRYAPRYYVWALSAQNFAHRVAAWGGFLH